uniref:Uncharacterized protein n=1 Tax=Ectopseudomonas mendocina (strain ymp) TaxID=399739 RepID=A4Y095_ECTM1
MGHSSTTPPAITTVTIARLCRSKEFQVRAKLCPLTCHRYAAAIKAGQTLPPLQVALVDGVPCLVDGYHRAAALEFLGIEGADAIVTEATRDEAMWMAAQANLTHGLPLKPREVREVFRVYIRTGRYKKGSGEWASYREMGLELGRPHSTIRSWMEKDFKKLYHAYGDRNRNGKGDDSVRPPPPPADAKAAIDHIHAIRRTFQETSCPDAREAIRLYLKALCDDLLPQSEWYGVDYVTTHGDF